MKRHQALLDKLANEAPASVYAFLGEEELLKDEAEQALLRGLAKAAGGEVPTRIPLHARDASPDDVEAQCSHGSLFGGQRLLVVDELEEWSAAEQKRLLKFLDGATLPPGVFLLLRGSERKLPLTPKGAVAQIFWKFFPSELQGWIRQRLKAKGLSAAPDVPELLVELYAGEDVKSLTLLAAEIDKLALFLGPAGSATVEVVRQVCSIAPQAEFFRLVDAVAGRRHREAMGLARQLLESEPGECMRFVNGLATRTVELMLVKAAAELVGPAWKPVLAGCRRRQQPRLQKAERDALDRNLAGQREELCAALPPEIGEPVKGLPAWMFAPRCLEADAFTQGELVRATLSVTDAEYQLKSGCPDPLAVIDCLITRICRPGL